MVRLSPVTAAKVALYCSLRAKGLYTQDLAIRLGVDEKTVVRWLDLDQRSSIEQITAALEALGQRVVVSVGPGLSI